MHHFSVVLFSEKLWSLWLPCCFLLGNRMILIIYQIYLFKQYHIFITIISFIFRSILMYCKHVSAWLIQRYAWNKRTTSWCFLLQKYAFRSLIFFDFFRRQGECGCPDNVYLPESLHSEFSKFTFRLPGFCTHDAVEFKKWSKAVLRFQKYACNSRTKMQIKTGIFPIQRTPQK